MGTLSILTSTIGSHQGGGSSLTFSAPLTSNLTPIPASFTPTFVRATAATVPTFDLIRTLLAGEVGHEGARRVENLAEGNGISSEDLTGWQAYNSPASRTLDNDDYPDGTTKSTEIVSDGVYEGVKDTGQLTVGDTYTNSVFAKGAVGGEFIWYTDGIGTGTEHAVTTEWARYSITFVAGSADLAVGNRDSGDSVKFSGFQCENVTGQSNQNPGEYVSVGVLSTPWHGAGVDGVKWFETENGNTVSSNVVTEATGAAIPAADLLGPRIERAATNLIEDSVDSTSWSFNAAVGTPDAIASPIQGVNAVSVADNTSNSTHRFYTLTGSITSGNDYVVAQLIKNIDHQWVALRSSRPGNLYQSFDISKTPPTVGAASVGINDAGAVDVGDGWYIIWMTYTADSTGAENLITHLNNSDTASEETYVGTGTGYYVTSLALETGTYPTTPIITSGAAATRDKTEAEYAITLKANDFTIACDWTPQHDSGATDYILTSYSDASNYVALMYDGSDVIFRKRIAGSNNDAVKTTNVVAGTTYRLVGRLGSAGVDVWVDTVKGTNDATATDAVVGTALELGALTGGSQTTQNVKNIGYYTEALTLETPIIDPESMSFIIDPDGGEQIIDPIAAPL